MQKLAEFSNTSRFSGTVLLALMLSLVTVACTTPATESEAVAGSTDVGASVTARTAATPTVPPDLPTPGIVGTATTGQTGLANPASVFCADSGGTLEMRAGDDGGQYGVCVFADGTECEEWALFRGDCAEGEQVAASAPQGTAGYVNEMYGFSIEPAEGWTTEEDSNHVIFRNRDYFLFVGYKSQDEVVPPFRTGMPSGEFAEGVSAMLLGQELPSERLVNDDKTKVVEYSPGVGAGDLRLYVWLDAEGEAMPYEEVNIPPEIIEQANEIIASFAFLSGETPELDLSPPIEP